MEGAEGFCKQRLEVKNEQRKHEYRGKNHTRTDNVCYRSGTHTQRNDRYVMCACMRGKGDVAVTQTNNKQKSAVKMLAALNFDLQNKEQHNTCTIKAANIGSSST